MLTRWMRQSEHFSTYTYLFNFYQGQIELGGRLISPDGYTIACIVAATSPQLGYAQSRMNGNGGTLADAIAMLPTTVQNYNHARDEGDDDSAVMAFLERVFASGLHSFKIFFEEGKWCLSRSTLGVTPIAYFATFEDMLALDAIHV